jgi:hypothetical protein
VKAQRFSLAKLFLFESNYIYPFLGFPIFLWLWVRDGSPAFAALVMGLPLVFGYVIPGIGTNILKMWRFHGPWLIGNYFIHQGFIYSATFGMELYLSFFPPAHGTEAWTLIGNMARTAAMMVFIGWSHDLIAVREGVIEIYNGPWKRGASPETIVAHSAPLCYALLGATYGAIATWGYRILVQDGNINALWWLFPLAFAAMAVAASVPYLLMEPR